MSIRTAPCDWPVSFAECTTGDGPPAPLDTMPPDSVATFEAMAVEYLWRWTGQSLGLCTVTVSLCRQDCTEWHSTFQGSGPTASPYGTPWTPVLIDGLWFNVGCGQCGDKCGCGGSAGLRLPGPIDSVTEIIDDGVVLDPSAYHVENHRLLVRDDGQPWAVCGLEITYTRGTPVPVGGQVAAGVLAVQLAKAACGDKDCQLPQRIQTITRQGVTIAMLDAFDDVDKGHTGIWIIDSWLSSMTKPPARPRILSPDIPRSPVRRITSPVGPVPPPPPEVTLDGGNPDSPGVGSVDGGTPVSAGTGSINGGTP